MIYDGEEEGGCFFFAVNEAVPLLEWSDISEYSVSRRESGGILLVRQRNYNKTAASLALPSHTSIFHPSLFYLPTISAISKSPLPPRANVCFSLAVGR